MACNSSSNPQPTDSEGGWFRRSLFPEAKFFSNYKFWQSNHKQTLETQTDQFLATGDEYFRILDDHLRRDRTNRIRQLWTHLAKEIKSLIQPTKRIEEEPRPSQIEARVSVLALKDFHKKSAEKILEDVSDVPWCHCEDQLFYEVEITPTSVMKTAQSFGMEITTATDSKEKESDENDRRDDDFDPDDYVETPQTQFSLAQETLKQCEIVLCVCNEWQFQALGTREEEIQSRWENVAQAVGGYTSYEERAANNGPLVALVKCVEGPGSEYDHEGLDFELGCEREMQRFTRFREENELAKWLARVRNRGQVGKCARRNPTENVSERVEERRIAWSPSQPRVPFETTSLRVCYVNRPDENIRECIATYFEHERVRLDQVESDPHVVFYYTSNRLTENLSAEYRRVYGSNCVGMIGISTKKMKAVEYERKYPWFRGFVVVERQNGRDYQITCGEEKLTDLISTVRGGNFFL